MTDFVCITSERDVLEETIAAWGSCTFLTSNSSIKDIDSVVRKQAPRALIVSGCKHILPEVIFSRQLTLNLHPSLLPYGRGPVPHIWTIVERTGIGVSLHAVDRSIDGGPIVAQRPVPIDYDAHTLTSAFELLRIHGALLLSENMSKIYSGKLTTAPQVGPSSRHTLRDQRCIQDIVDDNLKIPLSKLVPLIESRVHDCGIRTNVPNVT